MRKSLLKPTLFHSVALVMALAFFIVISTTVAAHQDDHDHQAGPSPVDPVVVPNNWEFKPEGLGNADAFRLLIVTRVTHDALSDDIGHYNHLVQDDVRDGGGALAAYADRFRVLGSTADVDARDNTLTNPEVYGQGIPVYWANGTRVADQYVDFYDGTWAATDPGSFSDGTAVDFAPDDYIITGTLTDGTAATHPLGGPVLPGESVLKAQLAFPGHGIGLSDYCYDDAETPLRFYALSGIFQVEG